MILAVTGDCSGECGNFTLARNGTCLNMRDLRSNDRMLLTSSVSELFCRTNAICII